MTSGSILGRALTQLVRGAEPQWPGTPSLEEIIERRDNDAALVRAWRQALPQRIHDAIAADAATVLLSDGSSLAVGRAEALLADKEQRRVYGHLRKPLARALWPFRQFAFYRNQFAAYLAVDDDVIGDDAQQSLSSFLASTIDEMGACRELLASLGGVALDDQDALARGLDLPDVASFSDERLNALVRQALAALPPGARGVQRVTAPRSCAGHTVDDAEGGVVRLWTAPTVSAGRFLAIARGAGRLLAVAAGAAAHAPGLGLAVVDIESRRALRETRVVATRALQISVATSLLWARAHAAVTLVALRRLGPDEEREEARGAVRGALGADGGDELPSALLLAPLPDGGPLLSPRRALVDQAQALIDVAGSWLGLREALDAGFLLRPHRLAALPELPRIGSDAGLAWRRLLGELL